MNAGGADQSPARPGRVEVAGSARLLSEGLERAVTAGPGTKSPETGAVEVRGVSKTFAALEGSDILALDGVSLRVSQGEFTAIVGPSGSGKSTLLKIVAGLIPPSEGEVRIHDEPVRAPSAKVGLVFQTPVLLPWRTVLENTLLPLEISGGITREAVTQARGLLELVGLAGYEARYPFEMSWGMQQRVAFTRALVVRPQVLLLDEPFAALDAITREEMNVELSRVWSEIGGSVVLVTHSISEAVFLADRVVVLSERPARVVGEHAVPFARPRDLALMATAEFAELSGRVRASLERGYHAARGMGSDHGAASR